MRIAFAGNPNSGKTTMYKALTGSNEHVGNWAGVTVDKKEALIKKAYSGGKELIAVDLPGAYSMSPFTSEESVTRDYIHNEHPDAIINIVDATNLSRSLFFTTQLLELGIPLSIPWPCPGDWAVLSSRPFPPILTAVTWQMWSRRLYPRWVRARLLPTIREMWT